jgi:hypothetical protein
MDNIKSKVRHPPNLFGGYFLALFPNLFEILVVGPAGALVRVSAEWTA